ncbi:MAG: hypothetical protein EBZ48_17600, partial [Proteobacteria bacterium]|nr:hypothetical protein [Pseudomonadota bacterium]
DGQVVDAELRQLVVRCPWSTMLDNPERFSSLSELLADRLGLDSIDAPIVDAVMVGHGIDTVVSCSDGYLSVTLRMPMHPAAGL